MAEQLSPGEIESPRQPDNEHSIFNSNFQTLTDLHLLHQGDYFDGGVCTESSGMTLGLSFKISSPFWNTALIDKMPRPSLLDQIENVYETHDRLSSFYFDEGNSSSEIPKELFARGYQPLWRDAWMVWSGGNIDTNSLTGAVDIVTDNYDLHTFLTVLQQSYQNNDPYNPYGELPQDQLHAMEAMWHKYKNTDKLRYFIVYEVNKIRNTRKPVSVSVLTSTHFIGHISSVGTVPETRGQGYGTTASLSPIAAHATLHVIAASQKLGNRKCILATEPGAYPHRFYGKLGFEDKFVGVGYTKNPKK